MKADQHIHLGWKEIVYIVGGMAGVLVTCLGCFYGLMNGKFEKIDQTFVRVEEKLAQQNERLTRIEVNHGERLARIEGILGERSLNTHNHLALSE